jgi:hypothetical protein
VAGVSAGGPEVQTRSGGRQVRASTAQQVAAGRETLFDSSKDIFADSSYGKGIVSALAEGAEIFA